MSSADPFGARAPLPGAAGVDHLRLARLADQGVADVSRLPITVKVLLENLLRHAGERYVAEGDVEALAGWGGSAAGADRERAFVPGRVLLQDFTGVPAAVDLAAMRAAVADAGGDPARVDPLAPAELVIDHSVQVDAFGSAAAYGVNLEHEYQRNRERYELLRWAQQAFRGFRVVPPGMGICHQVNLEHLARVVEVRDGVAFPDTLVGTDSHTPMVNGIGVLGWGVGGIEAEACLLGQPLFLLDPVVVGVRFANALPPGTTATDLVLTLTEMLRRHGVVGKFVEFCGTGLSSLTVPDRATMANMSPEFGATASLFPVDRETLRYLRETGRSEERVQLVERYCREQGLFRDDETQTPRFSELLELDLAGVEPSVAGPRRPQDRVALRDVWESFSSAFLRSSPAPGGDGEVARFVAEGGSPERPEGAEGATHRHGDRHAGGGAAGGLADGSVVIAAITSCTNTSNPSVMIGAGLLARRAVELGLRVPAHVKTSLAPGSRVVTDYLRRAGLAEPLDRLGFNLVGYGCTTCIGNSGPLPDEVAERVDAGGLSVVAVLSGNRNFEGRIHPQVRASYLASPPLVVAYALAGTVHVDLATEPLGTAADGSPVHLGELWPSADEVDRAMRGATGRDLYVDEYAQIFAGDRHWRELRSPAGAMFEWDEASTYVRRPPFFDGVGAEPEPAGDIEGARCLALLGDSITTDHISPAGAIARSSPAADYLRGHGVEPADFNSYGSRRGNHEVMLRGTFANIRLRNALAGGREGGFTRHLPGGELLTVYEAAVRYGAESVPLVVIAGAEYGSGSSRDWAAKGTRLLGVRAVIARSFERIHRSNLVGFGVLPLQFEPGESADTLGLDGTESYAIGGIAAGVAPGGRLEVVATRGGGEQVRFAVTARIDSATEADYHRHGGVLQYVLRQLIR